MPTPNTLTTGRVKPVGENRTGRSNQGVVFTRIRNVHRLRAFPAAPRKQMTLPEHQDFFEERFQRWHATYHGTRPEYICYWYLKSVRKMLEGIDFIYQSSRNGGRNRFGGSVVDFELPLLRLYFRIQGERFHSAPDTFAHDQVQRALLTDRLWKVVDIWAEDIARATYMTMEAALHGQELAAPRYG